MGKSVKSVNNRHLKDYSIRKSSPLACVTWCITATPTSTRNRRIIALRKLPTKSYGTSRKVAYVALYARFKGKRKKIWKKGVPLRDFLDVIKE